MTPATTFPETQATATEEAISFSSVSCLLSLDELSTKVEEQVMITWNGLNGGGGGPAPVAN